MVKNDICLGDAMKQNGLLFKKYALKNVPMPPPLMSRIGPVLKWVSKFCLGLCCF